jgi:ABC-type nitrate/sulfonate/bicarbonate transport system substrate-binding protein
MVGLKKGAPARMLVLFLLLAMIAAACGDDSAEETTTTTAAGGGEAPERASITFALTNQRAPQYYSYYLAEELGFYDEEGLDVEIVVVQGSSAAVQQIVGGNVDIGHPSAPATAQGSIPSATRTCSDWPLRPTPASSRSRTWPV